MMALLLFLFGGGFLLLVRLLVRLLADALAISWPALVRIIRHGGHFLPPLLQSTRAAKIARVSTFPGQWQYSVTRSFQGLPFLAVSLCNYPMLPAHFARAVAILAALISVSSMGSSQTLRSWSLPPSVTMTPDVPYNSHDDARMDILQPSSTGLRPGALVFHGGGYDHGNKREDYVELFCRFLVERGFVVGNVEFRLGTKNPAPIPIQDALAATRWFADHAGEYRIDPQKIIVLGASSGGHTALLVGMLSAAAQLGPITKVAAIIDLFGPTNLNEPGPGQRMKEAGWLPKNDDAGLPRILSPITHVRPNLPPVLIIHGDRDKSCRTPKVSTCSGNSRPPETLSSS
jgi:acetyl esterase/lipase